MFTEEAMFTKNADNAYVRAEGNPHTFLDLRCQQQFRINVWAGILGGRLIRSFTSNLPGRLTGKSNYEFLREYLKVLLEDIPLDLIYGLILCGSCLHFNA